MSNPKNRSTIRDWNVAYRLERELNAAHCAAIEDIKNATVIYFKDRDSTMVGVIVKAYSGVEAILYVGKLLRRILETNDIDASAVSARLVVIRK